MIDELLVENMFRNPEGNPVIVDTILLEMVVSEPNITLLLNTAVHDLDKSEADSIRSIRAFCSQNSTVYEISAPVFVDASGDGIVGFLSGAAFRMGAEARAEFGELFAPEIASNQLLGHTIYFYAKDTGRPVKFVPPSFALSDITEIPRWRDIRFNDTGCRLWWLEWVGTIPGKRESRRFEGDYMRNQQDVVEQRRHADAVSFGGWAIDLHPGDGVYSRQPGCQQWHSKGVYQIPYRAMYSRNIKNLFLAGRIISASHIAFGSSRVMATCAHGGQAVGMAAAMCVRNELLPRDLLAPARLRALQRDLLRAGQYIPEFRLDDTEDLVRSARISVSSELKLSGFAPNGETTALDAASAMMLPVQAGPMPCVEYLVDVRTAATLRADLRISSKPENHTPDVTLAALDIPLRAGEGQSAKLDFLAQIDEPRYAFVCLLPNPEVSVQLSDQRVTGVLAVSQKFNRAVAKSPRQEPPPGSGLDRFEFWIPQRRPAGKNLACSIVPSLAVFGPGNLTNGSARPTTQPNAWVGDFAQAEPVLRLAWDAPQTISRIELSFDTDFDHPMELVLMGHPERVMPFCVRDVRVAEGRMTMLADGQHEGSPPDPPRLLAAVSQNHQSRRTLHFSEAIVTDRLEIRLLAPDANIPAALFAVRCYARP